MRDEIQVILNLFVLIAVFAYEFNNAHYTKSKMNLTACVLLICCELSLRVISFTKPAYFPVRYWSQQPIKAVNSRREHVFSKVTELSTTILKLLSINGAYLIVAPKSSRAASDENGYISSLATMIEAKAIIAPTKQYIEVQAYDPARSNAQYILNQLQLQKNVQNLLQSSIDFCDDMDAIEEAQEAANRFCDH